MTEEVDLRLAGRVGRITLNRPKALNALTWDMVRAIDAALDAWAADDAVAMLVIDGAGERAFCAGGDIAEMYRRGREGDYGYARQFWADEYRMNRKLFRFPKPVASFLHGFVMGGGVGVGCHGSHRIAGESAQVAMPESGIGLIPDVGGSLLLARAPGRLGEYLGTTGARMDAADAVHAKFADYRVPEVAWPELIEALERTGEPGRIDGAAEASPPSGLAARQDQVDAHFGGETLRDILDALADSDLPFAAEALGALGRNSPISMACTVELVHRVRPNDTIEGALTLEHRYTCRSMEHGDFLEGVRAAIIDKDKSPKWRHPGPASVPPAEVSRMLAPLGDGELTWGGDMKVGFIGLGNMGAPMAANLARAGHEVSGFDVADVTVEGVTRAGSAAEAAEGAEVVITMLPNGDILRRVADQIVPAMIPGAVFLDCSTVDVASARAVAEQSTAAALRPLDAPVSGGVGGAEAGTLTFMAGGDESAFQTARPLFEVMGQKAVHCGASGNGQAAKICNNMILGATMIATCEAFALADKLGLDRQAMFDVVSTSSGYSWSMNAYCPAPGIGPQSPADNDYRPGFASDLMLKDLRLSQQAAEEADADTPMGRLAAELYRIFVEEEDGTGRDFSAMLPRFEKRGRGKSTHA